MLTLIACEADKTFNEFNYNPQIQITSHQDGISLYEGDTVTFQTNARNLRIKPVNASVSKLLKEWFKVWRVPRWERNGVPVIFLNEQAVALIISGQCIYLQPKSPRIKLAFTQG